MLSNPISAVMKRVKRSNKEEPCIFLGFFLLHALLTNPIIGVNANIYSRLAVIQSLVENNTFIIDRSAFISTIDKYFYNGHYYSDKPPILALASSVIYFISNNFLGLSFDSNPHLTYYSIVLMTVGLLTSIGLVYLHKSALVLGADKAWATAIVLVGGLGTLMLPYSTIYINHAASGALLAVGFYYLLRIGEESLAPVLAGLFISLAGSIDIAIFIFVPVSAIAIYRASWRDKISFFFAAMGILSIYFTLNFIFSGSFKPPAMNPQLWDYPGSIFSASNLSGLAKASSGSEQLRYAFHMLVGDRGLFYYTPVLVFSFCGALVSILGAKHENRHVYFAILLGTVLYICSYILRTNNYAGWSYGIRWYANLMLLLCLPLIPVGNWVRASPLWRGSFLALASISIFLAFIGVAEPLSNTTYTLNSLAYNLFLMSGGTTRILTGNAPVLWSSFRRLQILSILPLASFSCYLLFRQTQLYCRNRS